MALTPKQVRFVAAYAGDAKTAAIAAGYSPASAIFQGCKLIKLPEVRAAIRERESLERANMRPSALVVAIATREERQSFWTEVMKDVAEDMKNRLKAAELLGRSEADFTDKLEHSGKMTLEELVLGTKKP